MRWLFVSMALSAPLHAETIAVKTGEHADFSRVVLAPDRPTGWALAPTAEGYRLTFEREDISFDTRRAFDLIPRDRIQGIVAPQGTGALDFKLENGVTANSFETANGVVVIDFRFAPENERAEGPAAIDARRLPERASHRPVPSLARIDPASTQFYWRGVLPQTSTAYAAGQPEAEVLEAAPQAMSAGASLGSSNRLAEAEQSLIEELSRAAMQGLVHVDVPSSTAKIVADQAEEGRKERADDPTHVVPESQNPITQNDSLSYEMTTAIDRELPRDPEARSFTSEGTLCLPDSAFDFANWVSDAPSGDQIAEARRSLVGEFDRADPQRVMKLARLYLALSFGAEAESVLVSFDTTSADTDTLIYLARVIDARSVDINSPLLAMGNCDGAAALWALLGSKDADPHREMNLAAIQRAYAALPHALRLAVADRLIERLISNGAKDAAKAIRGIAARIEPDDAPARLSDARLDLVQGNTQQAASQLQSVVSDDGTDAVEALILLVDMQFENGIATDAKTVENVAALAFEHRFAPDGGRLARALVLSATAAGQFDQAVEALMQWPKEDHETRDAVAAKVFDHVTRNADDIDFLRLSLDHASLWQGAREDEALLLDAAERLLSLGFPAQALQMLGDDAAQSDRASLVMAQAYVGLQKGDMALAVLSNVAGDRADKIRAQALSLLSRPAAAAEAFARHGDAESARREAWKAADWRLAAQIGTEAQKEAISSLALLPSASGTGSTPSIVGPLEHSQDLIDQSTRMREALQALLKPST